MSGAAGRRHAWARVWVRLVTAIVVVSWLIAVALIVPAAVLGASPQPTPEAGGDTRSPGEGPGLVGSPLMAIGGVLALGIVAAAGTLLYVRATGGSEPVARSAPPAASSAEGQRGSPGDETAEG